MEERSGMPDAFDRLIGALHGLPDVTESKPSTIRTLVPLLGSSQTYIIQTYRQREQGDTIFIECIAAGSSFRIALPPRIADAIARQRESLTGKVRSKISRAAAQERKEKGIPPAFTKNRPALRVTTRTRKDEK